MLKGNRERLCRGSYRWKNCATSGSWRTSTPARQLRPSASFSTPGSATKSARCTTAPPSWIGWSRSASAASPSLPLPPPASGRASTRSIASTSLTRPGTWTSPSRLSAPCGCWMARWPFLTPSPASSPKPRPSGAKRTATTCRASLSSTRWTAWGPTSITVSAPCVPASLLTPPRFSSPSARKTPSSV